MTAMAGPLCTVTIRETIRSRGRVAALREVFGDQPIPIRWPHPQSVQTADLGERDAYLVDVNALDEATFARLVAHVVCRFGLDPTDVRASLIRDGLPVLAEDAAVSLSPRAVL